MKLAILLNHCVKVMKDNDTSQIKNNSRNTLNSILCSKFTINNIKEIR